MKLYIYDHCPYCVKARMIFGYKNILFDMVTLLNDDEKTPIQLIGQKMVPILSDGEKNIPESLDIIKLIDEKTAPLFMSDEPMSEPLNSWLSGSRDYVYLLAMPRWVKSDLEEFETKGAIDYFTKKKEAYIGSFTEHFNNSTLYIEKANKHLLELEKMMTDSNYFLGDQASINDINLFATLRALSITEGIFYPKKVLAYMKKQEELTKIPLHIDIAI